MLIIEYPLRLSYFSYMPRKKKRKPKKYKGGYLKINSPLHTVPQRVLHTPHPLWDSLKELKLKIEGTDAYVPISEIVDHEVARRSELHTRITLRKHGIYKKPGNASSHKGCSKERLVSAYKSLAKAFYVKGNTPLAKSLLTKAITFQHTPARQINEST